MFETIGYIAEAYRRLYLNVSASKSQVDSAVQVAAAQDIISLKT